MENKKRRLIVLQGLPASGKTTLAKKLVAEGYRRVNKDALREMFDFGEFSKEKEEAILNARDTIIDILLLSGEKVVVDDTNLAASHLHRIATIADMHFIKPKVIRLDVPLEECIVRDKKRDKPVGKDVIINMYNRYIKK